MTCHSEKVNRHGQVNSASRTSNPKPKPEIPEPEQILHPKPCTPERSAVIHPTETPSPRRKKTSRFARSRGPRRVGSFTPAGSGWAGLSLLCLLCLLLGGAQEGFAGFRANVRFSVEGLGLENLGCRVSGLFKGVARGA